jgi:sulfur carrier protein ThiS
MAKENSKTDIIEIDVETAINNQLADQYVNVEQAAYYINNGLTVVSNNTDIVPRDAAGNVIVQDGSYIVIETNSFNIDNVSMLKVLDTQFNHFKFPVSVNRNFIDPNFNFEFDQDPIFARYKPRYLNSSGAEIDLGVIPNDNSTPSGFNFAEIVAGKAQISTNRYTVSTEAKETGADLRFRVKIEYRCDSSLKDNPGQVAGFVIIKEGPNYPINREFRKFPDQPLMNLYQVRTTFLDVVIPNSEFEIGDEFQVGGRAFPANDKTDFSIYSAQSYWIITDASKNVNEWNQELDENGNVIS